MKDQGLTIEQVLELRKLFYKINNLSQTHINLTNQVVNLHRLVESLFQQRDQISNQIQNLNSELAFKNTQHQELTFQISNLKIIFDSIKKGNITYEKIQDMANNVAMSLIASRNDYLILALTATILTLRRDPTLAALLLAPVQGIQNPSLRDSFIHLAVKTWEELSEQISTKNHTALYEKLKQTVDELNSVRK